MRPSLVVEGPRDVTAVARAGVYRCILTHGFSMSETTKRELRRAARRRGVVVFTDPDAAGAIIRAAVVAVVGPCWHAHLTVAEARRGDNIGVENASPESIRTALAKAHFWRRTPKITFTRAEIGSRGITPAQLHTLGDRLRIGWVGSERLASHLNHFGISRLDFERALASPDGL